MEKYYAVIVAGGSGQRAGGDLPKQFHLLQGRPMLWWSMKAFADAVPGIEIIVALHPGFFYDWDLLCEAMPEDERIPHKAVAGGRTRAESVCNALMSVPAGEDVYVAVHDAARPLVSREMILGGFRVAKEKGTGVVPAVAVTDSLRRIEGDGSVAVNRADFVAVQTPQVFPAKLLHEAFAGADVLDSRLTDDASVAEAAGRKVALYPGEAVNMKVTNPQDFAIADLLLARRLTE